MSKIHELSDMDGCEGISVCGKDIFYIMKLIIFKDTRKMALSLEVTPSLSNFLAFSACCYFWHFYFDK